jgi:hypothetical protein
MGTRDGLNGRMVSVTDRDHESPPKCRGRKVFNVHLTPETIRNPHYLLALGATEYEARLLGVDLPHRLKVFAFTNLSDEERGSSKTPTRQWHYDPLPLVN